MNLSLAHGWWSRWQERVREAHRTAGQQQQDWCHAAMIAQAEYVMWNALYWKEIRP